MRLSICDLRFAIGGNVGWGGVCVWASVFCVFLGCGAVVSESALLARVEGSVPQWQGYQEDIKGQIGAGPVAEWSGEPVKGVREGGFVRVTFRLSGAWSLREASIPVLMRDPVGRVHRNSGAVRQDRMVVYEFQVGPDGPGWAFPWVEVKFPNGEKRIVFGDDAVWMAG